jgi:hypothetical protein
LAINAVQEFHHSKRCNRGSGGERRIRYRRKEEEINAGKRIWSEKQLEWKVLYSTQMKIRKRKWGKGQE